MPIAVTEGGMVREARVDLEKAKSGILVTDGGMVTDWREVQTEKACSPIAVSREGMGMRTDWRDVQSWKALTPIDVTDGGMVMEARDVHS